MEKQIGLANGQTGGPTNTDLLEKGQKIRFKYEDHARVMEMRPYIGLMKETILFEARNRKLKGTEF